LLRVDRRAVEQPVDVVRPGDLNDRIRARQREPIDDQRPEGRER
jgi:hypothetical protein